MSRIGISLGMLLFAVSAFGTSIPYSTLRSDDSTELIGVHTERVDLIADNGDSSVREFLGRLKTERRPRLNRQEEFANVETGSSANLSESVEQTGLSPWWTPGFNDSPSFGDWGSIGASAGQSVGAGEQFSWRSVGQPFQVGVGDWTGNGNPDDFKLLQTMLHNEPVLLQPLAPVPEPRFTTLLLTALLIGAFFPAQRLTRHRN